MKKIRNYHIVGASFVMLAGTLLHYVYDLSGGCSAAALIAAVNESTWEHLKLLFVPAVIFAVIEYFAYGRRNDGFLAAKAISIFAGLASIVTLFYTYTGIAGKNLAPVDVSLFFIAAIIVYALSYKIIEAEKFTSKKARSLAGCVLAIMLIMFALFTAFPPHIGLFEDPLTGGYGIVDLPTIR